MANNDVLVRMKADTQNYDANIAKARRSLESFKQDNLTLGGILNQTTRSLTAAAAGFASIAAVAGTIKDVVTESVQLAKAGEGIRLAFERLNRPDLLDGLREATHNTVTDIELMKQAVKFNDFRLSLDDMGAMLAFAQQKAKDTGESIDYMVSSITTGLGRQSLQILDNLGLSAAEIKERMKETGDMTKAVAEIIREKMDAAGGYVETAADRAAQADKRLKDSMEQLGETLTPLSSAASTFWTDFKTSAIDALNDAVLPLIAAMKYLGLVSDQTNQKLPDNNKKAPAHHAQNTGVLGTYVETTDANGKVIHAKHYDGQITDADKISYQAELAKVLTSVKSSSSSGSKFDASVAAFTGGEGFKADPNANFLSVWGMMGGDEGLRQMMGIGKQQFDLGRDITEKDYKKLPGYKDDKETKKLTDEISTLTSGLSSIAGGLKSMGIDLPEEVDQVIGVIQGVTSVIEGVNAIISIFSTSAMSANTFALGANTAALWAVAATNFFPFANGGVVHAANGYVDGNTYSGDKIPALLNAGELVLNRAQQGNLASQLEGGVGAMQLSAVITGEQLRLVLNNNGRRTGRGEYVTTNFR